MCVRNCIGTQWLDQPLCVSWSLGPSTTRNPCVLLSVCDPQQLRGLVLSTSLIVATVHHRTAYSGCRRVHRGCSQNRPSRGAVLREHTARPLQGTRPRDKSRGSPTGTSVCLVRLRAHHLPLILWSVGPRYTRGVVDLAEHF